MKANNETGNLAGNAALASIALGIAYLLTGRLGTLLALPPGYATAVYPASGIALLGILCLGYGVWPGVLLGSFFMNLWISMQNAEPFSFFRFLPAGVGVGLGASGEALLGAYLYRTLADAENPLDRVKSIVVLIFLSGGLSSAVSASAGMTSLCFWEFAKWGNFLENWVTWWLGDFIGILIVVPIALAVKHFQPLSLSKLKTLEAAALVALICLVSQLVFGEWLGPISLPTAFLIFPLLVLSAFRFDKMGAVAGVVLVSAFAVWGTVHGAGPFAKYESVNTSLILLQTYLGTTSMMTFILSAGIFESRATQNALHLTLQRLAKTEKFSLVMVTHVGLNGKWLKVPPTLCDLLGYAESELLADTFETVTHPDDFMSYWSQCQRLIRGEIKSFDLEKRFVRKDGGIVWAYLNCSIVEDSDGKPVHFITYVRDMTDRKRLEEELIQTNRELEKRVRERTRELERSNKDLEDFAYVASHDLQEPLRKITAIGDRLKAKIKEMDEQGWDYLSRMQNAALRMQILIDDLLEFSRVATKARSFETCDLGRIVKDVLGDLENQIKRTHGEVRIGNLPVLKADRAQMHKLFQNLISNSLKFHKEGEPPSINLNGALNKDTGNWEISVEDNGIGFEEKYLGRIFKPFERLHGRGAYEGTGMGLTICEKIITHHRGTITAKSAPGKGTTFIITLPDASSASSSEPPRVPA